MGLLGSKPSGPTRTVVLQKDPAGAPAVDQTKVREANPKLADIAGKAGIALSKRDLSGIRAQVVALVDHSGSMHADYASGGVATLVERALGFALQVDVDGKIPVIPFDSRVWPSIEVTQTNFSTVVADSVWKPNEMGSTNLAAALEVVKEMADGSDQPIFLVVATDGNPDNKSATTKVVCELAGYPVFIKFLALREVDYLSELDDLDGTKRLLDNVDAKPEKGSGLNLLTCTDSQFVDAMADEWNTWVTAALAAGVLKV